MLSALEWAWLLVLAVNGAHTCALCIGGAPGPQLASQYASSLRFGTLY